MTSSSQIGAAQRRESVFRIFDGIFCWKDWSKTPHSNQPKDRVEKLGNQQAGRVGVIVDFDDETFARKIQDGYDNPDKGKDATFWLEPDNLIFRPHKADGKDEDQVWALRSIADQTNTHNARENRSTPIVDQRYLQRQGYLHDLIWVKSVGDYAADDAGALSAAGEWAGIGTDVQPGSGGPRNVATLNAFKAAGFITDGEIVSQLKHVFKMLEFTSSVATGMQATADPAGGGPTVTPRVSASELFRGTTQSPDGDKYGELCLWSDVIFFQTANKWGPLGIDDKTDKSPSGVLCYGGLLWSTRKSDNVSDQQFPDPLDADSGKKASQIHAGKEPFPRKNRYQNIRPWIRAPNPSVATGSSSSGTAVPSTDNKPSGEGTPGTPTQGHTSPATLDFKPGRATAIMYRGAITPSIPADKIGWRIRYTIDTAPGGGTSLVLFLGYRIYKDGEAMNGTPVFLRAVIAAASLPTPNRRASYTFEIPASAVEPGDTIEVTLWRSAGDSYAGRFKLLEAEGIIGWGAPAGQGGTVWP